MGLCQLPRNDAARSQHVRLPRSHYSRRAVTGPTELAVRLSNYLFFTTACEQALTFYAGCGLGAAVLVVRHGENGMPVRTESLRGKIMHSLFEGPGVRFFASDNDDAEPMRGSAMMFELDDREQTLLLFTRLAEGGQVTTSLAVQPWGAYFGKLTDRFGVQWMFNCSQ
jgi:PhnB protein